MNQQEKEETMDQSGSRGKEEEDDDDDDDDDNSEEECLEPTLQNIVDQRSLRWIFVGGKGGVGKSSTSCSLGVLLASKRRSVLICSTDPAHNLSDAFGQKFSNKPSKVNGFDNLFCMEVDSSAASLSDLTSSLEGGEGSGLSGMDEETEGGLRSMMSEISSAIPGIDEALSFSEIMKSVDRPDFETIIFDTAPTGHTLRLLSFPRTMDTALTKLYSLKERFSGMLSQVGAMMGAPAEVQEKMIAKLEETKQRIDRVNVQFKDPDMTTFICVCIPEFLSVYETERLIQQLAKYEIDCHNIVVNQVLFAEPDSCRKLLIRKKMQDKYLDQIHDLYGSDFHVTIMPLFDEEMRGPPLLRRFAEHLISPYVPPAKMEGAPSASAAVSQIVEKFGLNPEEVYSFLEQKGMPVAKPK